MIVLENNTTFISIPSYFFQKMSVYGYKQWRFLCMFIFLGCNWLCVIFNNMLNHPMFAKLQCFLCTWLIRKDQLRYQKRVFMMMILLLSFISYSAELSWFLRLLLFILCLHWQYLHLWFLSFLSLDYIRYITFIWIIIITIIIVNRSFKFQRITIPFKHPLFTKNISLINTIIATSI